MELAEANTGDSNDNIQNESWADICTENKTGEKISPILLRNYGSLDTLSIHGGLRDKFGDRFTWKQLNTNFPARIFPNDPETKH